jgi:hypothetical protein
VREKGRKVREGRKCVCVRERDRERRGGKCMRERERGTKYERGAERDEE